MDDAGKFGTCAGRINSRQRPHEVRLRAAFADYHLRGDRGARARHRFSRARQPASRASSARRSVVRITAGLLGCSLPKPRAAIRC